MDKLGRFGCHLPDQTTVHLDAGYDSKKTRSLLSELGCNWVIGTKCEPLQAGVRWVLERTNSWHNRGFKKLTLCTERHVRIIKQAWSAYRWDTRPDRRP